MQSSQLPERCSLAPPPPLASFPFGVIYPVFVHYRDTGVEIGRNPGQCDARYDELGFLPANR